jgi:hypothetical protein
MRLRRLFVALVLVATPAAAGEIFRCVDEAGDVRFTNDPSRCAAASRHAPKREIQRPRAALPGVEPGAGAVVGKPSPWRGTRAALLALFEPAGADWEVVDEAASDPSQDPDLRVNGVRALAARHYTRARGANSQVCSVEIWAFEDAKRAGVARAGLERPGWRFHHEGSLLVMLRGVNFRRGQGFEKGMFPDCERLGERIRARVAARAR